MAGDWIKMRTSLLTNPKVNGIARELECDRDVSRALTTGYNGVMSEIVTRNVMRHVTVSSLLVIWGAANEHTKDGVFANADLSDIDDMVGIPGFGDAMAAVGWAVYDEESNSVTLPNFSEYNTSGQSRSATAKTSAERQKEYRERKKSQESDVTRDVTSDVTRNRREEKRREEDITTPNGVVVDSDADRHDPCPHKKIIDLYHEILPMCPGIRDWTPARQQQLRARWNEDTSRQSLDYWREFFTYVRSCDFLVGRTPKPFFADLEWLTKAQNFVRVREGKYENRRAA